MIWHNFKRPTEAKFSSDECNETYGRFVADPFERGWGNTVGNALRRALLSSIPGAAITAVKVEGADHEFSARGRRNVDVELRRGDQGVEKRLQGLGHHGLQGEAADRQADPGLGGDHG